jgi:hypothetical protein
MRRKGVGDLVEPPEPGKQRGAYLQVYPPNQTVALATAVNLNACTSQVFPLVAGARFPANS